ncbi:MAG: hypothetical protein M1821_001465 [Bathelium mastoideum]|nr:MAG: hypothetical protein M1821_001465 [Bathelium mastoideum]
MPATPPPAGRIHTPPAPLHGAVHDSYEPYSPRRSRRVLERQQKSPNPDASLKRTKHRVDRAVTPPARTLTTHTASQTFSPPSSPASPRTQKSSPRKDLRRNPQALGPQNSIRPSSLLHPQSSIDPNTSLPTPSKTPRKKRDPSQAALGSTSRVLFSDRPATVSEAMPTPRKGKHSRKTTSYGLDGYVDEQDADVSDNIEIYTDSRERVPTKDGDAANPFMNHDEQTKSRPKQPGKRRRGQSSADKRMEEAVENGEGMIYVFRGKRVFRSFDDNPRGPTEAEAGTAEIRRAAGSAAQKPITRSNFKPRLLFPSETQVKARKTVHGEAEDEEEDREAITDIDERVALTRSKNRSRPSLLATKLEDTPAAESKASNEQAITPTTTHPVTPATPPSTVRETRSRAKPKDPDTSSPLARVTTGADAQLTGDESGLKPTGRKRPSPFDRWPRAKSGTRSVSGTKREAEGEPREGVAGKRTRGGD